MLWHQVTFITAASIGWLSNILHLFNDEGGEDDASISQLRLNIAVIIFANFAVFIWLCVALLILKVFIKYGKPIEQNTRVLIQRKLTAIFIKE